MGDIRYDFCELISIDIDSNMIFSDNLNESLDICSLELLRILNHAMDLPKENMDNFRLHNELRNNIFLPRLSRKKFAKSGLGGHEKAEIIAKFRAQNEALNVKYMDGSLSTDWFQPTEISNVDNTVVQDLSVSESDLLRRLSELAVIIASDLRASQSALRSAELALQAVKEDL